MKNSSMKSQRALLTMVCCLLVTATMVGCHNYSANVGEAVGCTLAGNGCTDRGLDGQPGANGAPGANGSSCTVQSVLPGTVAPDGGARITCTDGSDALLLNGPKGDDGSSAPPTPYTVTQVIKPCPTVSGSNPEVLLVLANRSILASVSQSAGANTRLAFVTAGSYMTTDGRACAFTVTASQVSWSGGSASY